MNQISRHSRLLVTLAAGLALAAPLRAQETPLFTWTGRVDRRVDITAQGNSVNSTARRGQEYSGRFRVANALPQQDGTVRVVVSAGRGEAVVTEQPSAANNYRAVIRVTDRSSGADRYQLTAYYTPANTNVDPRRGGMGRYGRGMGRGPGILHWSGDVDADAEVRWQGNNVTQQALNGNPLRGVRSSIDNVGGRANVTDALVSVRSGRGTVEVVQQPSQSNNWTTVIRIHDPQGGYGRYSFDVTRP